MTRPSPVRSISLLIQIYSNKKIERSKIKNGIFIAGLTYNDNNSAA